jgi:acyl-CoA synthetase (AMP-forming)/AMP-acid ligase II
MLSIFASNAIALPLSPAFPTSELQYIMDNSSAKVLLATEKYAEKADQVLVSGLAREPVFDIRSKLTTGADPSESAQLELEPLSEENKLDPTVSGMMLYTSGTTNRPVCQHPT